MARGDGNSELYIIDISLGDGTGFDIIHWLRDTKRSGAPIIIASGYGDSEKIIYGLNIGADEFLIKPVIPEELIARVKAMLRRPANYIDSTIVKYNDMEFDLTTKEIRIGKQKIRLSKNESLLFEAFVVNQGKIVSREKILADVWGSHNFTDISDNTINVTLSNVRKKLGGRFKPRAIYNYGYQLD